MASHELVIEKSGQSSVKRQVSSLQVLRGVAALLVVLAHLIEHGLDEKTPNAAQLSGRFGVAIFFVISGFVIQYSSGDKAFNPLGFAIKRLGRVLPLYWATTIAVALGAKYVPSLFKNTKTELVPFIKSLLFIPYEYPAGSLDFRPVFKLGWTLNYEMFFYALMLCCFAIGSSRKRAMALSVPLLFLIGMSFGHRDLHSVASFYQSLNLLPFLAGVWLTEAWRAGIFDRLGKAALYGSLPITVIALWQFYSIDVQDIVQRMPFLIMQVAAILLAITVLATEGERDLHPVLMWIGDISYSIYLLHMFVAGFVWALIHKLAGHLHLALPLQAALALAIGLPLALALSHISYRYFEMPTNRWAGRIAKRLIPRRIDQNP